MGHRVTRTGRRLNDTFFRQAKSEGYVARSAFKLLEIQNKHKVIPIGGRVLDLGCHPGAWLQVACQSIGPPTKGGLVLGVDIQKTNLPGKYCDKRVQIMQADVRDVERDVWAEISPKVCGLNYLEWFKDLQSKYFSAMTSYIL
jgi:23S rRNA U2552 (ribose-2'-O)-methylase RlmE/FtsJ